MVVVENDEPSQILLEDSVVDDETSQDSMNEAIQIVPSRSVTMNNRQYLDVVYPGSGWIYLGEVSKDNSAETHSHLTYFGRRRANTSDTSFTLRATSPGTTILHFYKQDVLTATFIDDYIEVVISDSFSSTGTRVVAPAYSDIVPPYQETIPSPKDFAPVESDIPDVKEETFTSAEEKSKEDIDPITEPAIKTETAISSESIQTSTTTVDTNTQESYPMQDSELVQESNLVQEQVESTQESNQKQEMPFVDLSVDNANQTAAENDATFGLQEDIEEEIVGAGLDLLAQAQDAFFRGEYSLSAQLLEQFFAVADSQIDAGLYLKGQVFEAKSDIQNIRTALSAYKKIIDQYPLSPFWQKAKNRETYLNRFYFDIR